MKKPKLVLKVKMQTIFNLQSLTRLISIGLLIAIVSPSNIALALKVEEVPSPQLSQGSWITDMNNVLSPETEAEVNRMLSLLAAANGIEIAVVTVPETNLFNTPKEFANALFHYWKIGRQGQENGLLFLLSTGDLTVEIKVGNGVEEVISDNLALNIINQQVTPQIKQNNFDEATLIGTKALVANLMPIVTNSNKQSLDVAERQRLNTDWQLSLFFWGLISVVVAIVIIRDWYYLSQKVQGDLSNRLSEAKRGNSDKKAEFINKPRSTPAQPIIEIETDTFVVEEIANWTNSHHDGNDGYSSSSDCNSSDGYSSSSDCGSSSDSGSISDCSSSDSSW